jgi:hypothetical protein
MPFTILHTPSRKETGWLLLVRRQILRRVLALRLPLPSTQQLPRHQHPSQGQSIRLLHQLLFRRLRSRTNRQRSRLPVLAIVTLQRQRKLILLQLAPQITTRHLSPQILVQKLLPPHSPMGTILPRNLRHLQEMIQPNNPQPQTPQQ